MDFKVWYIYNANIVVCPVCVSWLYCV